MAVNIKKLLDDGRAGLEQDRLADESTKQQTFRIGSSGILHNGTSIGKCHRLAIARYFGIDAPVEKLRQLMFAAGRANEDIWYEELARAWDGSILREEEIPVSFTTKQGTLVTGRPDLVLCDNVPAPAEEGGEVEIHAVPIKGIELKLVCSVWTARDVRFQLEPKIDHLVQAANYSRLLNIPFDLWYTNRVDYVIPDWAHRKGMFDKTSPYVELNKSGDIKKLTQFDSGFMLDWDGGTLYYKPVEEEAGNGWEPTIITEDKLVGYFEWLDELISTKSLGPRPSSDKVIGGGKQSWSKCDPQYCPFAETCAKYERDFNKWVEETRRISSGCPF